MSTSEFPGLSSASAEETLRSKKTAYLAVDHTVASAPPQHILLGTSQSFLSQFLPKSHLRQYSALWEETNRYVRMSRAPRKREGRNDHHIVLTQQKDKTAEHRKFVWSQVSSGGRKHLKKPSKASFTHIQKRDSVDNGLHAAICCENENELVASIFVRRIVNGGPRHNIGFGKTISWKCATYCNFWHPQINREVTAP